MFYRRQQQKKIGTQIGSTWNGTRFILYETAITVALYWYASCTRYVKRSSHSATNHNRLCDSVRGLLLRCSQTIIHWTFGYSLSSFSLAPSLFLSHDLRVLVRCFHMIILFLSMVAQFMLLSIILMQYTNSYEMNNAAITFAECHRHIAITTATATATATLSNAKRNPDNIPKCIFD